MRPSAACRVLALLGILAVVTVACSAGVTTRSSEPPPTTASPTEPTAAEPVVTTTTEVTPATDGPTTSVLALDPYTRPGWTLAENAQPGTTDWRITDTRANHVAANPNGWIEGFAGTTSAVHGDRVELFVDTPAANFTARAFRMGWYQGALGRLVWSSESSPGGRQPAATFDRATRMAEAPWTVSLQMSITDEWPPGAYLVRLDSDAGGSHYVPLTVRHDAAAADVLFMNAVTTWQAYNPWGGCTLYACFEPRQGSRADVVSFDRPYAHSYGLGSADFLTHELPLLAFIEEQGHDTAYITNIDLHREPAVAASRAVLVSPGHDEYYSWPMRQALVDALDAGTNLAFFGANAVYRNIRLEPGADGQPERREVNYRVRDSGAGGQRELQTVNWREAPLQLPEAQIVGLQYGCAEVFTSMRLVNTGSWLYEGSGATDGQVIRNLVGVEFDEIAPRSATPPGLEIIAATPLECRALTYQQASGYHTRDSGAGVFAAGTINWNCALYAGVCDRIDRSEVIRVVTANVLRVFAAGPAGLTHPSNGNADRYRRPVHSPVNPPGRGGGTTTTTLPGTPVTDPPPPPTDPPATDPPATDPPATEPPPAAT